MKTYHEIPLEPINRTAAKVMSRGTHFEYAKPLSPHQSPYADQIKYVLVSPPPTPKTIKDWKGFRKGRMIVVAYSHTRIPPNPKKDTVHYWVVRCDCGNHEMRTNASLGRQNATFDCCESCSSLAMQRRHAEFLAHGRNTP